MWPHCPFGVILGRYRGVCTYPDEVKTSQMQVEQIIRSSTARDTEASCLQVASGTDRWPVPPMSVPSSVSHAWVGLGDSSTASCPHNPCPHLPDSPSARSDTWGFGQQPEDRLPSEGKRGPALSTALTDTKTTLFHSCPFLWEKRDIWWYLYFMHRNKHTAWLSTS